MELMSLLLVQNISYAIEARPAVSLSILHSQRGRLSSVAAFKEYNNLLAAT
jgi:hypothetical protein